MASTTSLCGGDKLAKRRASSKTKGKRKSEKMVKMASWQFAGPLLLWVHSLISHLGTMAMSLYCIAHFALLGETSQQLLKFTTRHNDKGQDLEGECNEGV